MLSRLKPWHWLVVGLHATAAVLLFWFALAYGGLPRLWSHHERKRIGLRTEIVSYTAQDLPADPINLRVYGSQEALVCAFRRAGWFVADPVTFGSAIKIAGSVILDDAYPQAPVSNLYVQDKVEDIAFERADGRSADKRHHVRFWQVSPGQWLGAASFDRGIGLSLYTMQITHHIAPDIDVERDAVGGLLVLSGAHPNGNEPSRIATGKYRNGGGDHYRSDGFIKNYVLSASPCR